MACGPRACRFATARSTTCPSDRVLADSYHVSRLNTNTGRLTEAMFHAVMQDLLARSAPDIG